VRLGRGEEQTGGRTRESILATTLEAVLGALYLEAGLDAVRRAVDRLASDA
jgi:ribonuclease-3